MPGTIMTCTQERYLLFLSDNVTKDAKRYLIECIERQGLHVEEENCPEQEVIAVRAPFGLLAEEAECIELEKKLKSSEKYQDFFVHEASNFEGSENSDTFFTPAEQSLLLYNLINKTPFKRENFLKFGIKKFKPQESIISGCLHSSPPILEAVSPMHSADHRMKLWKKARRNPFVFPLDDIQVYYGEEVAFYFAWMNYFTLSLIPVAAFGAFLYFHRPPGITVDDSPYLPAYALLMALWTIFFCKSWRRQESELALRWHSTQIERKEIVRPEFYGDTRTSPVTGKPERYYPTWKRVLMYCLSFIVTLPFLAVAVGAMILSLNFNGYVHDKESPIYLATLARYSEPGHIFAGDSPYYGWMVPTLSHSVIINILNRLYRHVSTVCTDLENHRTELQWNSSLIIKRVLFELFDCYLPLFYIAFYQLNIISLRRELIGLFWGDEIRRLVTESLIPFITEKLKQYRTRDHVKAIKEKTGERPTSLQIVEDAVLEEYEQFDDYLEMVVQFGRRDRICSNCYFCVEDPSLEAKLMYRKGNETEFGEDAVKEDSVCPISRIPQNAPDLLPVYKPPSQRGKSPIKGMFQSLMTGKKNDEDNGDCHENSLSSSFVDGPENSKANAVDLASSADFVQPIPHNIKNHVESLTKERQSAAASSFVDSSMEPEIGTEMLNGECDNEAEKSEIGDEEKDTSPMEDNEGKAENFEIEYPGTISGMSPLRTEGVNDGVTESHSKTQGYDENMNCSNEDEPFSKSPTEMSNKQKADSILDETKQTIGDSSAGVITNPTLLIEKEEVDGKHFPETDTASSHALSSKYSNVYSQAPSGISSANALPGNGMRSEFDSKLAKQIGEQKSHYNGECNAAFDLRTSLNYYQDGSGCHPLPTVGVNIGMILPPIDETKAPVPLGDVPSPEEKRVMTTLQATKVRGGVGMILPPRNPPSSGTASSSTDEGIDNYINYDYDDSDGSSSPPSIESFMDSVSLGSSKTEENTIGHDPQLDEKDIAASHSVDDAMSPPANGTHPPNGRQPSSQQEEPYADQHGSVEQRNHALPATHLNNEAALERGKQANGSPEVGASEDIYGTDESKCQSKQMRKNAFKGNEYEKEVRIERIRRMRREKEKSMEEEAKRRHEEEARLEEAKLKEGSQKSTRQEETDQKQVKEAYQENATQIKGMHKILPPLDAVREPTAAIGARSASPMERRIPCQTCEDHNVTPFQVVKYKKMKEVLEKCTRYSDVKGDQKYDYLCLSGVHIRNVNGSWQLADETDFHSESELTDSLDAIDSPAVNTNKDTIASKVNRGKQIKLNGGVCCHWIPLVNGGKWRVTGFMEEKLKPSQNVENDILRPSSSPCFGASEGDVGKYNTLPAYKEKPVTTRFNSMKDTLSKKMESTAKGVGGIVKGAFPPQRPPQEVYVPLEMLQFRERYVVPLGRVVGAIGQQVLNAQSNRVPQQIGDDSVNSDLGWLIRREFCTTLFTLILHRVKRDTSVTSFIMGRTNKFSLWSLIKDVSQACVEEPILREIVTIIEKSPFLFDDDLRARNFVCETLNWYNEAFTEKLLVTWLRYFTKLKHILKKYFEEDSVWRRPDRETACIVIETLCILGELNEFHFNLHADFEHRELTKRAREQDLAFLLQREPKKVDIDVMALE